jgi:hypothetical protein
MKKDDAVPEQGSGKPTKRGRGTKYRPEMKEQARNLALLGLIDTEIAAALGIGETTLNEWKKRHPEFRESLNSGKLLADAEVAAALFQRAVGYSHPDTHFSAYEGTVTATPTTKYYPPDTKAAMHWLHNRQMRLWKLGERDDEGDTETSVIKPKPPQT